MGLHDIARLTNRAAAPMLGGLGQGGNGNGLGLYSLEEAQEFGGSPIATPEEEQEILRRFELREFGPKGSPTNPPIGEVPGDLNEEFRLEWLNFMLGGLQPRQGGA